MSYSYAEFEPGTKFNVILGTKYSSKPFDRTELQNRKTVSGPNGSGKSTIVTDITIGLGGDLKTMKRQKELKDLVNKGVGLDEKAEIFIRLHQGELDDKGKPVYIDIRAKISKTSRTPEFTIGGRRVDQKEVQVLAKRLKIQTDNMCQFLPQDVVREFPNMSPEAVFEHTLRAAGNTDMLKKHDNM